MRLPISQSIIKKCILAIRIWPLAKNMSSFLQYLPLYWPVGQSRAAVQPTLSLSQNTPISWYTYTYTLWHYRLWSFQERDTKLERFLHKNQHAERKLLNFENWTNEEPQLLAKIRVDYFDFSWQKMKKLAWIRY